MGAVLGHTVGEPGSSAPRRPKSTQSSLRRKEIAAHYWEVASDSDPVARTLVAATHTSGVEVSSRVPYEPEPSEYKPPYDVRADLFELGEDGDAQPV